jgi:hypothetical protein
MMVKSEAQRYARIREKKREGKRASFVPKPGAAQVKTLLMVQ